MSFQEARRAAFLVWIAGRKVVKKYNASLAMNSDGTQFVDYRVNDRWIAWNAGIDSVTVAVPDACMCCYEEGEREMLQACVEAIGAVGVRVSQ